MFIIYDITWVKTFLLPRPFAVHFELNFFFKYFFFKNIPLYKSKTFKDIKGPDCFYVEEECKKQMNIPVFHDDQHGTAIICLAGIINVMRMKNMKIQDAKIVMVGAGAAGIACMAMVKKYGADPSKVNSTIKI